MSFIAILVSVLLVIATISIGFVLICGLIIIIPAIYAWSKVYEFQILIRIVFYAIASAIFITCIALYIIGIVKGSPVIIQFVTTL